MEEENAEMRTFFEKDHAECGTFFIQQKRSNKMSRRKKDLEIEQRNKLTESPEAFLLTDESFLNAPEVSSGAGCASPPFPCCLEHVWCISTTRANVLRRRMK